MSYRHQGPGTCPSCGKPTIRRVAGEWCPRCRGFIGEIIDRGETLRTILRQW